MHIFALDDTGKIMKNDDREIIQNLIEVLLDPDAREDEVDDAAIDLGDFDDDNALDALIFAANQPHISEWYILQNIGESIFDIWDKRNSFSSEIYNSLNGSAKDGLYRSICASRPEWIERYNIKID